MSPSGRLEGKVAFITGTGGGQGRAAAIRFVHEGATVVGCDLDAAGSEETARLIREGDGFGSGTFHSTHPLDLMSDGAPKAWIDEGVARFGRIDILYNNASIARMRPLDAVDAYEAFTFTIEGELTMVFATIYAAWPHLVAQEGPSSIVTTSSNAAIQGMPIPITTPGSSAGHSAAKAAVLGLTRQVAAEGAPHGIRANAILPGFIETGVTAPILEQPGVRSAISASIPLRRVGQPNDIALAAVYLASDESSWMTGETLTIDGGAHSVRR